MPGSTGFWSHLLQGLEGGFNAVAGINVNRAQLKMQQEQLEKQTKQESTKLVANLMLAVPEMRSLLKTAQAQGDVEGQQIIMRNLQSMSRILEGMTKEIEGAQTGGIPGGFKAPAAGSQKHDQLMAGAGAVKPESSPAAAPPQAAVGTPSIQAAASAPALPQDFSRWSPQFAEQQLAGSGAKISRDEAGRPTTAMFNTPEEAEAFKQRIAAQEKDTGVPSGISVLDAVTQGVSAQNLEKLEAMKVSESLNNIQPSLPPGIGVQAAVNADGSPRLAIVRQARDESGNAVQGVVPAIDLQDFMDDGALNPSKLGQLFGTLEEAKQRLPPEQQAKFEEMIRQDAEIMGRNTLTLLEREGIIKRRKGGGYDLNPFDAGGRMGDYGPRKADYIGVLESIGKVAGEDFLGIAATSLQNAPIRLMETLDKVKAGTTGEELAGASREAGAAFQYQSLMTQITDLTHSYAMGGEDGKVEPGTESTAVTNMLMFMADHVDDIGLADYLEEAKRTLKFLPDGEREVGARRVDQKLNMLGVFDGDLTEFLLGTGSMRRTLLGPSNMPKSNETPEEPARKKMKQRKPGPYGSYTDSLPGG